MNYCINLNLCKFFFHTTETGTDLKDKQFLAVTLHIREYILAVSMNICDVITVASNFHIHIRQCSHFNIHRKLLFFNELMNIQPCLLLKNWEFLTAVNCYWNAFMRMINLHNGRDWTAKELPKNW